MTLAERYQSDPYFHRLVDMLVHEFGMSTLSGAGLTPTEVREAAGFAWQIYAERNPHPLMIARPGEPIDRDERD